MTGKREHGTHIEGSTVVGAVFGGRNNRVRVGEVRVGDGADGLAELRKLVARLRLELAARPEDPTHVRAEAHAESLAAELDRDEPDMGRVRSGWKRLRGLLTGLAAGGALAEIVDAISGFL
ncbi:hypothetical protein [Longimycelium tulufanense]|uniref:hypothetical protein n=1 Tax=Longimycelium tulufanense TaxID=907463 RepID=UPI00166B51EF|nr:hypothetical protein [Longimycelium tulufanense]